MRLGYLFISTVVVGRQTGVRGGKEGRVVGMEGGMIRYGDTRYKDSMPHVSSLNSRIGKYVAIHAPVRVTTTETTNKNIKQEKCECKAHTKTKQNKTGQDRIPLTLAYLTETVRN